MTCENPNKCGYPELVDVRTAEQEAAADSIIAARAAELRKKHFAECLAGTAAPRNEIGKTPNGKKVGKAATRSRGGIGGRE